MSAPSAEERSEAVRWLGGAEEELEAARVLARHGGVPNRTACFHGHLAAEKALKALLIATGVEMPHSHDLGELKALVPPASGASIDDADLKALNPWTIDGRYPEDAPDVAASEVRAVVETAERVVAAVREVVPAKDEHGEEE